MHWDRFDRCEAYYMYSVLWHSGQTSKEYAILGQLARMGFKPSPQLQGRENLEENGREIYDALVEGAR